MTKVVRLWTDSNRFEGVLPEVGAASLISVSELHVSRNNLQGMLPEQGLQSMTRLTEFWIYDN
eukprot:2657014-Amphidinium_carterae.1